MRFAMPQSERTEYMFMYKRLRRVVQGGPSSVSTTGYFEFERRNNIYDVSESFLFDIYEMGRYTLEQLGNIENLLPKW